MGSNPHRSSGVRMTKSGNVRINELSRALSLPSWRVVFDAAKKLSIPVKSHSGSITEGQAETVIGHLVAEGHLTEDSASAYKNKAVQKEKTVGPDKPGQAQPASRLKAKAAVTARPALPQASAPRKPAPKPSSADQKLHRKPSRPAKEPAPGPVRLASTSRSKKDPRRPSVVKVKGKPADQPAKGKTLGKGSRSKAGLTLVKPPSAEPKPLQKPRLVRPTVVRPTAPKKSPEVATTAGAGKASKARAGSPGGKSP
ncbi:MAG TPA: hypothetical protein DD643_00240 [Synechococcus sp. UBA8638]|nr:hypothetical protein [Synechococcus sp. UBA8638]